jgi:hypothetical protein
MREEKEERYSHSSPGKAQMRGKKNKEMRIRSGRRQEEGRRGGGRKRKYILPLLARRSAKVVFVNSVHF